MSREEALKHLAPDDGAETAAATPGRGRSKV
jgi:hypothetical protein